MDIVTHGLMGIIGGSAIAATYPEAAAAFAFGNVLPDLDAFSRVLGKRAFLGAHQTWSHALPVIGALGLVALGAREATGTFAPWAPLALSAGMALHAVTDWTNTYGIMLLAPFSRRRYCREWVFFIDAFVIAACALTLAVVAAGRNGPRGFEAQAACGAVLLAYWLAKVGLRARALRRAPQGVHSLLPSALVPWEFLGCARVADGRARTFRVSALTGAVRDDRLHDVLDGRYQDALAQVPEFAVMRALSAGYHVVEAAPEGERVTLRCRDLRTRNFATRFGGLDVTLGPAGRVEAVTFHV